MDGVADDIGGALLALGSLGHGANVAYVEKSREGSMKPKQLAASVGVLLVIVGIAFMAAQFVWPSHFAEIQKHFHGWGIDFQTNVAGFGVLALGVVLLMASLIGRSR